jgi:hypothetical protein
MKAQPSETGRYYAGNQSWQAWERIDFEVKIDRIETLESEAQAEALKAQLEAILKPYGATVTVNKVQSVFLPPTELEEFLAAHKKIRSVESN